MKTCVFCGAPWRGYGPEPRTRERCAACGRHLRCCTNCHHLDRRGSNCCKLSHTDYIGPRDMLNYCDEFRMVNRFLREVERRHERARDRWEALFPR